MAIVRSCALRFLRIVAHPIFPASANTEFNACGQKVAFLLFLHIVSGLFVFIGVYAAEQARSDEANVSNWIIMLVFIIIGDISLFVLIIRGCQNKLRAQRSTVTRTSDPSLNLRILFLWIFGLAVIIHVLINSAIYIECITSFHLRGLRVAFSWLSNLSLLLFLFMQTSFISYYRNSTFMQGAVVNIASILILSTNFIVWFDTVVSSINVFDMYTNTTIPTYSNESYCFRTSSIQTELLSKIKPFLSPPRLEFCILASSFIISFWGWPIEREQESIGISINEEDEYQTPSTERRQNVIGPHVFVTVFGIILNIPIVITKILLVFAFNWERKDVFFALDVGQCISSICSIIAIYISSYHLIKRFENCWRPARLTTNEYILITTSSGVMGYYFFGLLTSIISPDAMRMFLISRIINMLETFLQTYFLLKIKRYITEGQASVLISSTGIFLMIKNLIYWFVYSYNSYYHTTYLDLVLVDKKTWIYIHNILGPVIIFYRFFSGMISYSVYFKFRPNR